MQLSMDVRGPYILIYSTHFSKYDISISFLLNENNDKQIYTGKPNFLYKSS
jgi:hypothetical protein